MSEWMHPLEAVEKFVDPKPREEHEAAKRDLAEAKAKLRDMNEASKARMKAPDFDPAKEIKLYGGIYVAQSDVEFMGEMVVCSYGGMVLSIVAKLIAGQLIARGKPRNGPAMEIPQDHWKELLLDAQYARTISEDEMGPLGDGDYYYSNVEIRQA